MPREPDQIHLATLNVRYDTHSSNPVPIPDKGHIPPHKHYPWTDPYAENPWSERRSRLVDALKGTGQLDIVGFQEVLHNQLQDLKELLGEGYDHVGVGRDDGKEKGEYSPIFWDKELFEVVRWKSVWLSPTPEVPGSVGWDASQTRIATFLTLSTLKGSDPGLLIHIINTHYDDAGVKARAESSLLIRAYARRWVDRFEDPQDPVHRERGVVVLLGDFNSPDTEDGYKNITSPLPLPSNLPSLSFIDSYHALESRGPDGPNQGFQSGVYGPKTTYSGFTRPGKTATARIDFVMLARKRLASHFEQDVLGRERLCAITPARPDKIDKDHERRCSSPDREETRGDWKMIRYAVIDNFIEEGDETGWFGRWSDHRAVRVTIQRDPRD